ncbi:hypothetical protein [Celeribacter litoreus]|uniref:hypothetical protein n=1 Tax=Celeribacter litoreus TaxID=2876714 RepID=UPI001CCE0C02|nr:hypothetical protein [Celeribacter litoreus]MCA0043103.1 hypothetical protein [Celeribacter litoreus]
MGITLGKIKTHSWGTAIVASLCCITPAVAATSTSSSSLARHFAYCAGRLSADAAHFEDHDLYLLKEQMLDLLAATIDPADAETFEELRIAGHVAQSELRATTRFSFDQAKAERAETIASEQLTQCRSMLLGG